MIPLRVAAIGLTAAALVGPFAPAGAAAPSARAAAVQVAAVRASAAPAALLSASRRGGPTRILLTPTTTMARSQEVSWTMPAPVRGQRVQYRTPGGPSAWATATRRPATRRSSSGTVAPRYEATLRRLAPATTYEYRILTPRGSTGWRRFRTAGPATATTTIIGLGDTQVDNRGVPRATIRQALAAAPEASLVLQAGDLVNVPTRAREWDDLFAAIGEAGRTRNWIASIGNHELCCGSNAGEAFRSYFDWPSNGFPRQGETWFHVDHQGVRIVVLDSFGGRMSEQAAFLDHALATNPHRWSIVLMHAPPFATRPGRPNPEVVARWLPILEARDADLVLTGHDHAYARGYHRRPNGPVLASSVSGPKYYELTDADWVANGATQVARAAQTATYQVITVTPDRLDYRAVVSARGAASTAAVGVGGVLDRFVIDKSSGEKVVR